MTKRKLKKKEREIENRNRRHQVFKMCEEMAIKIYKRSFKKLDDNLKNEIYAKVAFQ